MLPRPLHSAAAAANQQAWSCHIVTVPPTGRRQSSSPGVRYPWHFIQPQKAKGRVFFFAHSHGTLREWHLSEYEQDFLPSVWHSMLCSCILNFRVAFNRKELYMIVGCECVAFRWKIFSPPRKAFVGCQKEAREHSESTSASQRFRCLQYRYRYWTKVF